MKRLNSEKAVLASVSFFFSPSFSSFFPFVHNQNNVLLTTEQGHQAARAGADWSRYLHPLTEHVYDGYIALGVTQAQTKRITQPSDGALR
ncbi:MAG: hypothetical protein ACXVJJ_08150 [Halobacteriota archaeon]